ncbi:hypothetical protein Sjap_021681 [Stephania japonica]|uniref:Uncharacterized protein n=1 Tax=Stephania japonica TaxID=461633 RepID=A0AAP0EMU5_9MAGN
MVGIHLQRAMVVALPVSVPIALIWSNKGQILVSVGQDREISMEASRAICPIYDPQHFFLCYVILSSSCKNTWTGFSSEPFHKILNFLKLAIPSAAMVCLEIWTFELVVLLSGFLPNPKLETSAL